MIGKNEDYLDYNKCLNDFRVEHYNKIKNNRHLFFAHFDKKLDYEDYYCKMLKFDIEEETKMCSSFLKVQQKLSKIYLKLFDQFVLESLELTESLRKRNEETKAKIVLLREQYFFRK